METLSEKVEVKGTGIPNLTATCIERTAKKALYERKEEVCQNLMSYTGHIPRFFQRSV